jgi:hypothetical protein
VTRPLQTNEVAALCRRVTDQARPRGEGGGKAIFLGAMPAHSLPTVAKMASHASQTVWFVANTHTRDKPGEHWVAFYFSPRPHAPLLFDSFGRTPKKLGHKDWGRYMSMCAKERNGNGSWRHHSYAVQDSRTDVCGVLCAYWAWREMSGCPPLPRRVVPVSELRIFLQRLYGTRA